MSEWALYKQIASIRVDTAWRPMEAEGCPLVGKS
jgi:hypothetical protein